MEFFKRKKNNKIAVQTAPPHTIYSHPFRILDNYETNHASQLKIYSALREAVPIIDAAISKIVRLTGEFRIECDNEIAEKKLNKFVSGVHVNSCATGLTSFISLYLSQLLTYGTAVGEIVISSDGENIEALYNASLDNVELKASSSPLQLDIYRKSTDGTLEKIKYPDLILITALNPEPGSVYGNSVMKGLPFVSNILLKIFNTIGVNWDRVGNVRFAVTYKPPNDASERVYSRERATQIASEWSKAMKSGSDTSDFIAVGDVGIKVIGADNQILDSQIPVRQMLEQIVSKLSIPPFLLGLNWSTTETMSTQQAEILNSELESYRRLLNPIIRKVCDMWLIFNSFRKVDYEISWSTIDLKDRMQIANTRLTNARATEIEKRIAKVYGTEN